MHVYEGLSKAVTYVTFNGNEHPRFKLDPISYSSGMTAGVYWASILSGTITSPFLFEQQEE